MRTCGEQPEMTVDGDESNVNRPRSAPDVWQGACDEL